jgi:hypothetical protein
MFVFSKKKYAFALITSYFCKYTLIGNNIISKVWFIKLNIILIYPQIYIILIKIIINIFIT